MNDKYETINEVVSAFIGCADKLVGVIEGSEQHRAIIDMYNSNKPGSEYQMTYTDPWCAAFVGAVSAMAGTIKSVPLTAACSRLRDGILDLGGYEVFDPQPGDIFIRGNGEHTGIIKSVSGGVIHTIEGNYSDSVSIVAHHSMGLRFYRPKWSNCIGEETTTSPQPIKWEKYRDFYAELPTNMQRDIKSFPLLYGGCGGVFVKILQKYLGKPETGRFDTDTESAVKFYQKKRQLEVDGQVGKQTWSSFFV